MRNPLFNLYVKLYNCDMEEAMIEDLKQFPTFSDFFKRRLRPDARTINGECEIVSPFSLCICKVRGKPHMCVTCILRKCLLEMILVLGKRLQEFG